MSLEKVEIRQIWLSWLLRGRARSAGPPCVPATSSRKCVPQVTKAAGNQLDLLTKALGTGEPSNHSDLKPDRMKSREGFHWTPPTTRNVESSRLWGGGNYDLTTSFSQHFTFPPHFQSVSSRTFHLAFFHCFMSLCIHYFFKFLLLTLSS